jgi:hypothetical protein
MPGKKVKLFQTFEEGTTGQVIATLEDKLIDTVSHEEMPAQMVGGTIVATTGQPSRADVIDVPSTLYPSWDTNGAYIRWQARTVKDGYEKLTVRLYETPEPNEDDDPVNIASLHPLNAGSLLYGIGGVRVFGSGILASIVRGELQLEVENLPDTALLDTEALSGDTAINLRVSPAGISPYSAWAVIEPYTTNCEIRQVVSFDHATLNFGSNQLKKAHPANTAVMLTFYPVRHVNLYGAKPNSGQNDTPAFQAALADLSGAGGVIILSGGDEYRANILLDQDNVALLGDSMNSQAAVPSRILSWDPNLPAVQLANGTQRFNLRLENVTISGGDAGKIGLYIAPGAYSCFLSNISVINCTEHCLKIGDVAQQKFISYIFINGLVLQASQSSSVIATLGIYGGDGTNYTTAIFIDNIRLSQVSAGGVAILVDNAGNTFINNSYLQCKNGRGIKMQQSGGTLPRLYFSNVNVDNETMNSITVQLMPGFDSVTSYISGLWKMVGKVQLGDGITTYDLPGFGTIKDNTVLQAPRVIGAIKFADLSTPSFASAPDFQVDLTDHKSMLFRSNSGGDLVFMPNNTRRFAIIHGIGPLLESYTQLNKPGLTQSRPVSMLSMSGGPTGGTFTITVAVDGGSPQTTNPVAWNAAASDIVDALEALSNVGVNNAIVWRGGTNTNYNWLIQPSGKKIGSVYSITANPAGLTGGSGVDITPTAQANVTFQYDGALIHVGVTTPDGAGGFRLDGFEGGGAPVEFSSGGGWHQFAARDYDNGFLVGQGIRAGRSASVAAGLYVPWILNDTTNTGFFGRNASANNQTALRAVSYSSYGLYGQSTTGYGVLGQSQAQAAFQGIRQDGAVGGITTLARYNHRIAANAINLTESGGPTGGTFLLNIAVNGGTAQPTTPLAFDASSSTIQAAIQALTNVLAGNAIVTRTGTGTNNFTWSVTPAGDLTGAVFTITVDASGLTGGSSPLVTPSAATVPLNGFGTSFELQASTNNSGAELIEQLMLRVQAWWTNVLHGARTSQIDLMAADFNTQRTAFSIGSDGSHPLWSFGGNAPSQKATITGSRGGNVALGNLLTELDTKGFLTNATTA